MSSTTVRGGEVGQLVSNAARLHPEREALVTRSGRWSYRELDGHFDRARDALWALGVRPGDRIAASLPNDFDLVCSFHGAQRLGALWVGINQNLAAPEKEFLLDDSGATVLVGDQEVFEQLAILNPSVRRLDVSPGGEWSSALRDAPTREAVAIDPFAPAALAYTSGTTGRPKGALHTQHNLVLPGAALCESRNWDETLRKGDCFPLTILNLQILSILTTAHVGGCAVVMDRMDAEGVAGWIEREAVTVWTGPPAMIHSMTTRGVTPDQLSSLREVWSGGADCPESLRKSFSTRFGRELLATYGLSEAPTVVTIDPPNGEHVQGASGKVLPHLALRIVDENDQEVPAGETGEICVSAQSTGPWAGAYQPMLGYLGHDVASASSLAGDVLHTGDVGFLDADGFLHVRDRKNLVILRGGANVYPAEVERVLAQAPGIRASGVFGVADERLGERVMAVVEIEDDTSFDEVAVREFCERQLAKYKVPERFFSVAALPRNAMGKIIRSALPEIANS